MFCLYTALRTPPMKVFLAALSLSYILALGLALAVTYCFRPADGPYRVIAVVVFSLSTAERTFFVLCTFHQVANGCMTVSQGLDPSLNA